MVCLGNICRSPLAHGILEHLAREKGLDWEIDSAGTGDWHVGQQPDKRSIAVARKYGIDISAQCGRQISKDDLDYYDKLLVMDKSNLADVIALTQTDRQREKVSLFLGDKIVPDPYYDDTEFEPVYQMIEARCRAIIDEFTLTNT